MARLREFLDALLAGRQDQSIRFESLCNLLQRLGFDMRARGSHHVFTRDGVMEILNRQQRDDGTAKPYQVKQVRNVILKYRLTLPEDDR